VQFATATEWVARLSEAKRQGSLEAELRRLSFIPLLVVDEVGYIPFDPEAANLMFSLVSSRYERASMIVTSNKPFSAWGEIFGDDMAATHPADTRRKTPRDPSARPTPTQTTPGALPAANRAGPAASRTPVHDHTRGSSAASRKSLNRLGQTAVCATPTVRRGRLLSAGRDAFTSS